MYRFSGLAFIPPFISLALVDLARFSEVVKVLTLLLGCAISLVMLVYWVYKTLHERSAEILAEIKLAEAEKKAQQTLEAARVQAAKMVSDVAASLKVK